MLIVRGVNVFPVGGARGRERVRAPRSAATSCVRPRSPGIKQEPPLPVSVELARGAAADPALADAIRERLRSVLVVQTRVELVPWGSLRAASTSRSSSSTEGGAAVRKLQSQGVHHITIVGADRQTSIDFWEGLLGMPFVFEQPNLDNAAESHLYFDPGDGRLITVFTNEEPRARPRAHADRPRLRAPPRVRALAGDLPPGRRAARRARDPAQRRQGPRLHGLDLLRGPARAPDRARVVPLRAAVRPHPRRRAARGAPAPRRARRRPHRPGPRRGRDRDARRRRRDRCRRTARRRIPTTAEEDGPWPRTR